MSDELLTAYDADLRGVAEVASAPVWDTSGPLWRARFGDSGFVTYESLAGHDVEALVAETVAHFAGDPTVDSFEWKTRGHDDLPDLHAVLLAAGLVPDEPETVMVGDASALAEGPSAPDGVVIRRIDDLPDRVPLLAAATLMQREVFGRSGELLELVEQGTGRTEVWVAQLDAGTQGRIVSCGRLEEVPDTAFAGLWGGATVPEWRGRGLYRAMTAARACSALGRGLRYLHSDCTPMSRPILERSGLRAVTTTTPYLWRRAR
ncbi:MAG: GNAT family N-acetyltransferase [Nocardioides sp.]